VKGEKKKYSSSTIFLKRKGVVLRRGFRHCGVHTGISRFRLIGPATVSSGKLLGRKIKDDCNKVHEWKSNFGSPG